MANQAQLVQGLLAQLRTLDPSISGEVGTPERKMLDSVAQALADAQINLSSLSGALDLDSKIGDNLDRFLALFGFARQVAVDATGYATFTRNQAFTTDIVIPAGTQLYSTTDSITGAIDQIFFVTQFQGTLPAGNTSIVIPIRALVSGSSGNVAAHTITNFSNTPVFGITGVSNDNPTTGGMDAETDDEFKVRFKNGPFRNLAGTQDQFMALAAATKFSTKINVIGPISRYREYIQVPQVDDASSYEVNDPSQGTPESGNGNANQYTTALSTIPYSKHVFTSTPNFVSNGQSGASTVFYREGVDYQMNTTLAAKNRGDAYRFWNSDPLAGGTKPGPDPSGTDATYQPNVTFLNVYSGVDTSVDSIRPRQVVLFEHAYMSTASRNNFDAGVTNAVDVYIDGSNDTIGITAVPVPGSLPPNEFSSDPNNRFYVGNYRRKGQPDAQPTVGNVFFPLFFQPVTSLPEQISIAGLNVDGITPQTAFYYLNQHYFLVEDYSNLYGTVRARNGIEWLPSLDGYTAQIIPGAGGTPTGATLASFAANTTIPIPQYTYDKNVIDLQASLEGEKQITTDVLVHRSKTRYFRLDITVVYGSGVSPDQVNSSIQAAVQRFLDGQYFGTVIETSDLMQTIHNVPGVQNVRWSSDIPGAGILPKVIETDVNGNPRFSTKLSSNIASGVTSLPVTSSSVYAIGQTVLIGTSVIERGVISAIPDGTHITISAPTVYAHSSGDNILGSPAIDNVDFFLKDNELPSLPTSVISSGGVPIVDPTNPPLQVDTVPGLRIRARAENTWIRG